MRLSDARTRGPWREKWVQFVRANDIVATLEDAISNADKAEWPTLYGAYSMALLERAKIFNEIKRALTVGPDEPKKLQGPCRGGNGDAPA